MEIHFTLDNPKRERSTVRARVTLGGKRFSFHTKVSVPTRLFANQRCKSHKEFPEAPVANFKLDTIETAMRNAVLFFSREFKTPSQAEFTRKVEMFLAGNNAAEIKRADEDFVAFVERFIKECTQSPITVRGYGTALNKIKEFQKGKRLSFADVDMLFHDAFTAWLRGKGFSRNYTGTIIKNVKVFMRAAREKYKLHDNADYEKFRVEQETADTIFLSIDELERIHRMVIDESLARGLTSDARARNVERKVASLNIVKNKFLIGACCAMRVSDFNRITEANVKGNAITIMPAKGASLRKPTPVTIPMHRIAREILASGFDLNCKISEQKINKHIKEICRAAGINERVTYYRTEGGKLVERVAEKWQLVTTHTARRSGATNMDRAGMPARLIMACTGHRTRANLEKYVKSTASDDAREIERSAYFSGGSGIEDVTGEWVKRRMREKGASVEWVAVGLGVPVGEVESVMDGKMDAWRRAALFLLLR